MVRLFLVYELIKVVSLLGISVREIEMARQADVIREAIKTAVREYEQRGYVDWSKRCGMNLDIWCPTPSGHRDGGQIVMSSYGTPIARVDLGKRDENGHVGVELSARYYNYSVTTSRHLTYFLMALSDAGLIGQDVFDRRAKRYKVEARAIEALHANNDNRHNTWFTL